MKRKSKFILTLFVAILFAIVIMPISAFAAEVNTINLLGDVSCVHEGVLPTAHVDGHDEDFTVQTVKWVYYDTGESTWKEFVGTPTAVNDGTKYGLKISLLLDSGYTWAGTVTITYNEAAVASSAKDGNDVYIDLGTVNDRQPVKFDIIIGDFNTNNTPNDVDSLMSLGTDNDLNTYAINGSGITGLKEGFDFSKATTTSEFMSNSIPIDKDEKFENKIYAIYFGVNFKIGYDPTMDGSIIKINGQTLNIIKDENDNTFGVYYIVDLRLEHNVTYNANGHGTAPANETIKSGDKITKPSDLSADGYTFGGWYTDAKCTNEYDFNTKVNDDITLYAKWTAVETKEEVANTVEEVANTADNNSIIRIAALGAISVLGIVSIKKKEID